MERKMDTQPSNQGASTPHTAEEVLKLVIQDLDNFRQDLTHQLGQDVSRLRAEKEQLNEDVNKLRKQYEQLQVQQLESLSQRQIAQQQLWLKQLAQVLANNLQKQLGHKIKELKESVDPGLQQGVSSGGGLPMTNSPDNYYESANELGSSLSATLSRTFDTLKQELDSYESDLCVQLNNMRGMEQQSEVILETLLSRLQGQLESNNVVLSRNFQTFQSDPRNSLNNASSEISTPIESPEIAQISKPESTAKFQKSPSQVQIGLILALLSAAVLSLFNVCVKMVFNTPPQPYQVFGGLFSVSGLINPDVWNSLLILLLRQGVVMLLMPLVATFLYPAVWSDIEHLIKSKNFSLWWKVIGSAFFLFLSQVLIYISIGNIPTGIAMTIFFIYPIITVLLSWGLFGDSPSVLRICAMVIIGLGGILVIPGGVGNYQPGVMAGVAASITFSGYILLTQMSAGKLHPIPFSLINFAGIFVFSALGMMMPKPVEWSANFDPSLWSSLIVISIILGFLTISSYVLNSFAIKFAGAARASIMGTLGPPLTALIALFTIGEALGVKEIFGIILVIIGVAAMSFERMFGVKRKPS
ncbi:MAG: EamA family transporter [Trichodesmium sp. MAG_R01]|nr:EamA family transporter [Trichodesmium sp. MAG_R01]